MVDVPFHFHLFFSPPGPSVTVFRPGLFRPCAACFYQSIFRLWGVSDLFRSYFFNGQTDRRICGYAGVYGRVY